jgi:hypothetical protein
MFVTTRYVYNTLAGPSTPIDGGQWVRRCTQMSADDEASAEDLFHHAHLRIAAIGGLERPGNAIALVRHAADPQRVDVEYAV